MDLHRAHMEAHRLEHGRSPEFQQQLMERLGYPKKSPFGRPMPGMGQVHKATDVLTLEVASTNKTYIVDRVPEDNIDLLRFLVDPMVILDQEIMVLEATPYLGVLTMPTSTDRVSIGYDVARNILVRPPEEAAEHIAY